MAWKDKQVDVKVLAFSLILLQAVNLAAFQILSMENSEKQEEVQLTTYQKNYVDCPRKYLEACTNLSRRTTANVEFKRYWQDRLYLETEENRTIVAKLGLQGPEVVSATG